MTRGKFPSDRPRIPAAAYQKPYSFLYFPTAPVPAPCTCSMCRPVTSPSATAGNNTASQDTPGSDQIDAAKGIVLLSCGHWVQTVRLDEPAYHCRYHNGMRAPAADMGIPAVLTGWEYARETPDDDAPDETPEEEKLALGIAGLAMVTAMMSPGSNVATVIAAVEEGTRIALSTSIARRAE